MTILNNKMKYLNCSIRLNVKSIDDITNGINQEVPQGSIVNFGDG